MAASNDGKSKFASALKKVKTAIKGGDMATNFGSEASPSHQNEDMSPEGKSSRFSGQTAKSKFGQAQKEEIVSG